MENQQDGLGLMFKSITMLKAIIHYKVLKMLEVLKILPNIICPVGLALHSLSLWALSRTWLQPLYNSSLASLASSAAAAGAAKCFSTKAAKSSRSLLPLYSSAFSPFL